MNADNDVFLRRARNLHQWSQGPERREHLIFVFDDDDASHGRVAPTFSEAPHPMIVSCSDLETDSREGTKAKYQPDAQSGGLQQQ